MFAIGAIFHILLTGKFLIDGEEDYDTVYENQELSIDFKKPIYKKCSHKEIDLLKKLVAFLPSDRISATEALKHDYFH
jgi:serine/threonine protein kinase